MTHTARNGAAERSGAGNQPAIGDVLRDAVEKSGLTWYQLSQETGLLTATLYKWRDGGDLSQRALETLAEYFGLALRPAPKKRSKRKGR